ncbi:MAG: NAD-dependent epimerase/dehydratase family protein [Candidatus Adiutrix sp.]|jgi:UDP-glucose 4-epimerase|nr:NAD-dependent epimerase/dehydratase family protein [Candidatus Adiutrix sp.]
MTGGPAAKPPRSLVTGGAGFIGSHLAEALWREGGEVRILDDFSTGRRDNLPPADDRLEVRAGSITDEKALAAAMEGVDYVFHLAGLVAVPESVDNPRRCIELNDLAVFNTYLAALEQGARRVVFSSSSAVYGETEAPHHEGLCPRPNTPYAIAKLLGEHYGLYFHSYRGLESVYLRYFNVYGPRQRPDSEYAGVISLFMEQLERAQPGLIYGDGQQTRDFIYVDDVVRANLAAASRPGLSGLAFNIGRGRPVTIAALYRLLADLAGRPGLEPRFAPPRPGDIRHSFGPVDLAADRLGFRAEVDLRRGLARTRRWFTGPGGAPKAQ